MSVIGWRGWTRREVASWTRNKFVGTGRRRHSVAVAASLSVALTVPLALGLSPSLAAAAPTPSPYDPALFASAGLASVTLPGGVVVFDTDTDTISQGTTILYGSGNPNPAGIQVSFNGINVETVAGSPDYTVFEAQDWTIPAGTTVQAVGSRPLVLLALRDISVAGRLSADAPPTGGPGVAPEPTVGQGGSGVCSPSVPELASGGGGGGFGGSGGTGGPAINNVHSVVAPGGFAGASNGLADQSLNAIPGSDGGNGASCTPPSSPPTGGAGGGAVVVAALDAIDVSGTISANGGAGAPPTDLQHAGGGGGSGGAIVVTAPAVTVNGYLCAVGASGGGPSNPSDPVGGAGGGGGGGGRITAITGDVVDLSGAHATVHGGTGAPSTTSCANVDNDNGATGGATGTITSRPFLIVDNPAQATTGDSVPFAVTPAIGALSSVSWDFGDGGSAAGSTTAHVYSSPGTYAVTVTATVATSGAMVTAQSQVTVTGAAQPTLASIAVNPAFADLHPTQSQQFSATGTFSDTTTADLAEAVTWTSTNPAVATVDSAGQVTAVAPGPTQIVATSTSQPEIAGVAALTVSTGQLDHLVLSPASATTSAGIAVAYDAEGFDQFGDDLGDVTAATNFAVSPDGSCAAASCTANSVGAHQVIGTDGPASGTAAVTVTAPIVIGLAVAPSSASIVTGGSTGFTATAAYSDGTHADVTTKATWTSSNPNVATVASSGVATGIAPGMTQITTSYTGLNAAAALAVGPAQLAYVSTAAGLTHVFVVNADGTGVRQVTSGAALDTGPVFSPDGTKIAFASSRSGNGDIYVVNVDGSGLRRITTTNAIDTEPAWSPNGAQLAYVSTAAGLTHVFVVNADGTGVRQVTSGAALDTGPVFSPDGTKIAFASSRSGNGDIYVVNVDGSGLRRITTTNAIDLAPNWQP